uniref:Calcium load-activated calcium channel n=1 Tax=Oreochromis aureus TaxID=47969 RepID=A0AAZ1XH33_OREAU
MKSMFTIGFCFTALMGIFDGRVVAKLPFVPLSYIQGLSHRNLLGEDYTDCSFIFLYILCTMSIRQVTSILLPWYLGSLLCPASLIQLRSMR